MKHRTDVKTGRPWSWPFFQSRPIAAASAAVLAAILAIAGSPLAADSPYAAGDVIEAIHFNWDTHDRRAPGSDNWPVTWADDDHQYTSWGDGGGFGGTNELGRVSLGVARVEGSRDAHTGHNVWGGHEAEHAATFGGKSYGIICVDGVLYMWVSPGSGEDNYTEAKVYRSTDHGASWSGASWAFTAGNGFIMPTFLQFGKNYEGARDTYVYVYANHLKRSDTLAVQVPGEIALMRTARGGIMDRGAYEFFAGLDGEGNPTWTGDIGGRAPVFQDPAGVGWNTSASYNAGIGRYFLITEHTHTFEGTIGIFDAPEPWGPWTTVLYSDSFGEGEIAQTTFFFNFANKWLSADGKDFVLVFTGIGADTNDSWNTVQGSFDLYPPPEPDPVEAPAETDIEPFPDAPPPDGTADALPDLPPDAADPDAMMPDAGHDPVADAMDDTGNFVAESSCGCAAAGAAPRTPWGLLLLLLVFALRRPTGCTSFKM